MKYVITLKGVVEVELADGLTTDEIFDLGLEEAKKKLWDDTNLLMDFLDDSKILSVCK